MPAHPWVNLFSFRFTHHLFWWGAEGGGGGPVPFQRLLFFCLFSSPLAPPRLPSGIGYRYQDLVELSVSKNLSSSGSILSIPNILADADAKSCSPQLLEAQPNFLSLRSWRFLGVQML